MFTDYFDDSLFQALSLPKTAAVLSQDDSMNNNFEEAQFGYNDERFFGLGSQTLQENSLICEQLFCEQKMTLEEIFEGFINQLRIKIWIQLLNTKRFKITE